MVVMSSTSGEPVLGVLTPPTVIVIPAFAYSAASAKLLRLIAVGSLM